MPGVREAGAALGPRGAAGAGHDEARRFDVSCELTDRRLSGSGRDRLPLRDLGTQFPQSSGPPAECSICLDERQYVGDKGQQWTTLAELRSSHGLPLGPRRRGPGALLAGDIIQVVADRDWVSFMWSYPNLIPLPAAEVQRIRGVAESLTFDRLYGAWWGVIASDAKTKVLRSADRYLDAISRWRGQGEL